MSRTPGEIIAKYIEIRDAKKALEAAHKTELARYDNALDTLANALHLMQQEQGVTQFKVADVGTAFQTTTMRVKMADRETVIEFVLNTEHGFDIFTNSVSKDYIKTYIEQTGHAPPGIDVEYITEVQVRKA